MIKQKLNIKTRTLKAGWTIELEKSLRVMWGSGLFLSYKFKKNKNSPCNKCLIKYTCMDMCKEGKEIYYVN